jgi:organic radical activating enzyme
MSNKTFKVSEIFESIQGEGRHAGVPMLFIRLSGCTRACRYCDTKYHTEGREMSIEEVANEIRKSRKKTVCWTGGEPLMQLEQIKELQFLVPGISNHHIETNGDLFMSEIGQYFTYLAISPKVESIASSVKEKVKGMWEGKYDIKVVTDLETEGKEMIPYATMLMPLTTFDDSKDLEISKKVWQYCVEKNIRYSSRLQIWTYKKQRGI